MTTRPKNFRYPKQIQGDIEFISLQHQEVLFFNSII